MSDTTNQPQTTAVAVAVAPDPEKQFVKTISAGQFVISLITISLVVGGSVIGGVSSIKTELADLRQTDALTNARLTVLEKKADGYDRLIEQRNMQWQQVQADIASIKTSIGNLEEDKRQKK